MGTTEADKRAYCSCMDDIRRRLAVLAALTSGKASLGDEIADAESACLQMRKVLEQIAFASLAASREAYAAARPKYIHEWRANQILSQIAAIHPDFYPRPVSSERRGANHVHFTPIPDGFLTRDDFAFLYDTISDVLHAWNPFQQRSTVVQFGRPLSEWIRRIEVLLSTHYIRLVGQEDLLLIQLQADDGKAHAFTASPHAG